MTQSEKMDISILFGGVSRDVCLVYPPSAFFPIISFFPFVVKNYVKFIWIFIYYSEETKDKVAAFQLNYYISHGKQKTFQLEILICALA